MSHETAQVSMLIATHSQPPVLIRLLFFLGMTSMHLFSNIPPRAAEPISTSSVCLPLMGLLHAMAVHVPSIIWSNRVHKMDSVLLMEHMVYYFLMQVSVLSVAESFRAVDQTMLWTIASHFALYYAWHIYSFLHHSTNCTLSPTCLTLSMASFVAVTTSVLIGNIVPQHYREAEALGGGGGGSVLLFGSCETVFRNHLVALFTSDITRCLFIWACSWMALLD